MLPQIFPQGFKKIYDYQVEVAWTIFNFPNFLGKYCIELVTYWIFYLFLSIVTKLCIFSPWPIYEEIFASSMFWHHVHLVWCLRGVFFFF